MTKHEWRRRAASAHQRITIDESRHLDALGRFLLEAPRGWTVVYDAIEPELDVTPLMARAELGPFALTRTPERGHDLTLHPYDSPKERHRFGYRQPKADSPEVADGEVSVVLVPGLAFDRGGYRLGRGKGYYDRLLGRLGGDTIRVGVTGGYVVAELPVDDHDIAMTHLVSDFGVLAVPLADPE